MPVLATLSTPPYWSRPVDDKKIGQADALGRIKFYVDRAEWRRSRFLLDVCIWEFDRLEGTAGINLSAHTYSPVDFNKPAPSVFIAMQIVDRIWAFDPVNADKLFTIFEECLKRNFSRDV